jgi:hypothetical protein
VTLDHENKAHTPVWSLERTEPLDSQGQPSILEVGAQDRETTLLGRWLSLDIRDRTRKTLFVIHYLDKLTPYSQSGIYPRDINQLITLIQKIIENIEANNRLIMVALDDSMIPLEYYTHSPRVAVLPIPLPDRTERRTYFAPAQ